MSLIIGMDLSLNSTGVCIIDLEKGTPVHYESISSGLEGIERLNYNYDRYKNLFISYPEIEYVAFEAQNTQMRFAYNAGSILKIAENVGVWELSLYHSLPYFKQRPLVLTIPAQDIKKFATDNGQATKEDMIAAVNGNHIKSIKKNIPEHSVNDVADAYHIARMTRDLIVKSEDYSKYILKDYRTIVSR